MSTEWISSAEAAALLDRHPNDAQYLARTGHLRFRRNGRLWEFDAASVRAYVEEEARWISADRASELTGVGSSVFKRAAKQGLIEQRKMTHSRPSLLRESALAYAETWQREQAEARQRATDEREARRRRNGPPQDGDVWLSISTAALVIGVSERMLVRLAAQERLPATRSEGGRWWLRRQHVEQWAAARALSGGKR